MTDDRAGLLARLLRRPCDVCERHKHHRDPYYRARPACPERWHRQQYGRRKRSITAGSGALGAKAREVLLPEVWAAERHRFEEEP